MNERIQELAEQSGMTQYVAAENKYLEKFAELIIRECANVANTGIDPAESHLLGDDILEHFGVEE